MSSFHNAVVLVTGGASGIGRMMAAQALHKGCAAMVLWDVNEKNLNVTVSELSAHSGAVHGYRVDVSDPAQVRAAADAVLRDVGPVDILINNAGIVVGKYFHEHTPAEIVRTMAVNAQAPMHTTLAFLPSMIERRRGHVVTISSAAGMVGNPRMSVYAASKWAAIGWSDSLRLEMERLGTGVHVTCVTPYYIDTGMFDGVKSSFLVPINEPGAAVRSIMRGVERNALHVRMPLIVYTLQLFKGVLPTRWFDRIVGDWLKVYSTMDEFVGRTP